MHLLVSYEVKMKDFLISQAVRVGGSAIGSDNKGYHPKLSITYRENELKQRSYCVSLY
jgi:hypothetical protein